MSQRTDDRGIQDGGVDRRDGDGDRRTVATSPRVSGYGQDHHDHDMVEVKNRVQVGPILAGVLTTIGTMLILTVLGLAIGATALDPADVNGLGWGTAIYGIISAVIAFFLGGWVAAKTAAVAGAGSGMINGLMVGLAILAIILWLTGSGVAALLGTLGTNIGDIVDVAQTTDTTQAQAEVQEAVDDIDANEAFDTVRDSAWGTLAGIVIPLAAAAIGGMVGQNKREDVIQSANPAHTD